MSMFGLAALAANSATDAVNAQKDRAFLDLQRDQEKKKFAREDAYQADVDSWRKQQDQPSTSQAAPSSPPLASGGSASMTAPDSVGAATPADQSDASSAAPAQPATMAAAGMPQQAAPAVPKSVNNLYQTILTRAAIDFKHGKLDGPGMIGVKSLIDKNKTEGIESAINLMDQGQVQAGIDKFNSSGDINGMQLVGAKDGVFEINGMQLPTKIITTRDANGNTATINTAQARYQMQGMHDIVAQTEKGAGTAALSRLSKSAQDIAQQDIPVTAAPVKTLSGNDPNSSFQQNTNNPAADGKGLSTTADPTLLTRIQALPDSDPNKAAMIEQLQRQQATDQSAAQAAVAGQTRKPTSDEALSMAMDKAKLADPQAYMAGRGLQQDNLMKIGEGDTIFDKTTGKVLFANTSKADREEARNVSREAIAETRWAAIMNKGEGTSLTKNVQMLRDLNYSDTDIKNFIFNKKESSLDDLAGKILTSDPNAGTKRAITPEQAVERAIALRSAIEKQAGDATTVKPSTAAPAASSGISALSAPATATPTAGKPRYPDGTKLSGPGGKPYIVKNGVPVPQ